MTKVLRSSKTKYITLLTLSKLIFHIFSWNELKSVEFNSSFATRRRNAEIIKKKKIWKSYRKRENERISRIF